jgi:DNA ligase-associated metallophosphoesterase
VRGRVDDPSHAELTVGGETLVLLPQKAAFLPAHGMLLVADAHIGKAVSFRRAGIPVPQGTTAETLDTLSALVRHTAAARIVFLGDFLHSARGRTPATLEAVARWRAVHAALSLTLVRGNHDRRAGDPPPSLGFEVVDEPLSVGGLALAHHPAPRPHAYVVAGHLHPCVTVGGRAFERLRLPCFHFGRDVGVLPAFGSFTGAHPIRVHEGDRVFAVADDAVAEVRAGAHR